MNDIACLADLSPNEIRLIAENERLRAALEQYANHGNWGKSIYMNYYLIPNGWQIAEAALNDTVTPAT